MKASTKAQAAYYNRMKEQGFKKRSYYATEDEHKWLKKALSDKRRMNSPA